MVNATEEAINAVFKIDTVDELRRVSDAIHDRHDTLVRQLKHNFHPGDRVKFTGKRGRVIRGEVVKQLQKNVRVLADDGITWTVGPSLLTKED